MPEEKQGGSSARMKPGEEGRGGCRQQRRPEKIAEPTKELKRLIAQAEAVFSHLGHEPQPWRIEKTGECAQLRCAKCLKTGGIAVYPMRGKDQINGFLAEERCEVD